MKEREREERGEGGVASDGRGSPPALACTGEVGHREKKSRSERAAREKKACPASPPRPPRPPPLLPPPPLLSCPQRPPATSRPSFSACHPGHLELEPRSDSAGRGGQGQQPAAPRPCYAAAQMQSPHTLPTPVGLDSASAGGARSGLGRRRSQGHLVLNCILEQKPSVFLGHSTIFAAAHQSQFS